MKSLLVFVVVCLIGSVFTGVYAKHTFKRKALSDITELSIDADFHNGQYISRNERIAYEFPTDTTLAFNNGNYFQNFPFIFYVPSSYYPLYFPTQRSTENIRQSEIEADNIDKTLPYPNYPTPFTLRNLYPFDQLFTYHAPETETHASYQGISSNENNSKEDKTTELIKSNVENPKPFSVDQENNPVGSRIKQSEPETTTKQYVYPLEYYPYPLVVPITQRYPSESVDNNYSQDENKNNKKFLIHVKDLPNIDEDDNNGSYNENGKDGEADDVIVNPTTPRPVQSASKHYDEDRRQLSKENDQVIDFYKRH